MLLGTLGASLFGSMLEGKGVFISGDGVIRAGEEAITTGQEWRANRVGEGF